MARRRTHAPDPVERAIEEALQPGHFIPCGASSSTRAAQLEGLSHYTTEPAAKRLDRSHPDVAAKVYRALGMRILKAKKSRYYGAALSHFESARRCYERAGLRRDWEATVAQVRKEHQRKTGFMGGFEKLVAGRGPSDEPSFLDRARSRRVSRERP